EYEPLPAVTDVGRALDEDAPRVHDELDSNSCYVWTLEAGELDRLFAEADVTVDETYRQQRLIPNAIEPRGVLAQPSAAMGAFPQLVTPGIQILGAWLYGGSYAVQGYHFTCEGVFTHTTPTDAYRGAGRPEATFAIERAVDALARKLGRDPVELRRQNFI